MRAVDGRSLTRYVTQLKKSRMVSAYSRAVSPAASNLSIRKRDL